MGPLIAYNYDNTLMVSQWTGSSWSHSKVHEEAAAYNLVDIEKIGDDSFCLFHSEGDVKVFRNDGGSEWKLERRVVPEAGRVTKAIKIHDSHPDIEFLALENVYVDWFATDNVAYQNQVWTVGTNGKLNTVKELANANELVPPNVNSDYTSQQIPAFSNDDDENSGSSSSVSSKPPLFDAAYTSLSSVPTKSPISSKSPTRKPISLTSEKEVGSSMTLQLGQLTSPTNEVRVD